MNNVGYVLGNGPSRDRGKFSNGKYYRTDYNGVTYGCNSIYKEINVDVLVCMDMWYQFEVIASGYPTKHKCLFGDWNPMPIQVSPVSLNPPNYDLHYYNPKDEENAGSWCYYATSAADYEKAVNENYAMSYWKPDCGYVCWVGEDYKIKEVNYGVIPIGDLRPPSGAYALQEALKSGHDRVEVFGFDSIAGVFSTTSAIAFKDHDSTNDIVEDRMDKWITFYKTITEHYNEIEIIWHNNEQV